MPDLPFVRDALPVETNIVIFQLHAVTATHALLVYLKENNILASAFGKDQIRFVMHLDISDNILEKVIAVLRKAEV